MKLTTIPCLALATFAGLIACHKVTAQDSAIAGQKARLLVAYYSRSGNTEQFAAKVAEGAQRVKDTVVVIKRVEDVQKSDLEQADAIALGTATYFANIPGKMKVVIDDWNWKWKVDFTDKVGGAFSTGGGQTGGKEFVVVSLLLFMINNRMVVAGPLYSDAEGEDIWGEVGATAMTGPLDPGVSKRNSTPPCDLENDWLRSLRR